MAVGERRKGQRWAGGRWLKVWNTLGRRGFALQVFHLSRVVSTSRCLQVIKTILLFIHKKNLIRILTHAGVSIISARPAPWNITENRSGVLFAANKLLVSLTRQRTSLSGSSWRKKAKLTRKQTATRSSTTWNWLCSRLVGRVVNLREQQQMWKNPSRRLSTFTTQTKESWQTIRIQMMTAIEDHLSFFFLLLFSCKNTLFLYSFYTKYFDLTYKVYLTLTNGFA